MTQYYNPTTGRWESREELGERPATAETVLASEATTAEELWATIKAGGLPPGCGIALSGPIEWRSNESLNDAILRALDEKRVVWMKNFAVPPGG